MTKWFIKVSVWCLFSGLCLAQNTPTATFSILIDPIPNTWSNYALSGDGTVMAAIYGGEIYRWTAAGGFQDLGLGDTYSSSIGISRDGSTIISGHIGSDGFSAPAIWNANGLTDLGHPSNGSTSIGNSWGSGYGLNADGSIAVGLAWTSTDAEGFIWTAKAGNHSLGHPPGSSSSRASAISANGKTVVGFWEGNGQRRPVRWVGSHRDLFLGTATFGEADEVTSDGKQIAGQTLDSSGVGVAFVYSDQKGLHLLGTISHSPTDQSFPNGISDNGRVIGWSGDPFGNGIQAFFWTPTLGMQKLAQVLQHFGANIPAGMKLTTALSISADGSTMVGQYVDSQFHFGNWIAHFTK